MSFWGRDPDWYSTLDTDLQTRLFVDFMMCHESPDDAKKKNQQAKMDRIKNWRRV